MECVEELKLDRNLIEDNHGPGEPFPEDNKDLNSFFECTWRKAEVLKSDDTINWDKLSDLVLKHTTTEFANLEREFEDTDGVLIDGIAKNMVDACQEKNIHGDTLGQMIAKLRNCLSRKLKCAKEVFE